jgi:ferritin-like metal-binding protein YciE
MQSMGWVKIRGKGLQNLKFCNTNINPILEAVMKQNAFYEFFVDLLKDIFSAENQIIEGLPKVIKAVHNSKLKQALTDHLQETKNQVVRLKTIFKILNENPSGEMCKGMKGIIDECAEEISKKYPPLVEDAALIIACQKVEHYEIANYGSARALARHLQSTNKSDRIDFDEIADLLQETLDEEGGANDKLTDIAEGGFFTTGINDEAEEQAVRAETSKKKK